MPCSVHSRIGIGLISGSFSKDPILAIVLSVTIACFLITFGGFYNDPEAGPEFTKWMRFGSPFLFLRDAALKNEFEDLDYDDDVIPEPKERYNYNGGISENVLYSFIHFGVMYAASYIVYRYRLYKITRS